METIREAVFLSLLAGITASESYLRRAVTGKRRTSPGTNGRRGWAVWLLGSLGWVFLAGSISAQTSETLSGASSRRVQAMAVAEDYPFLYDRNGDGRPETREERDFVLVAHLEGGLLIFDATHRDDVRLVGQVKLPGTPADLNVDPLRRRVYVTMEAGDIHVVDFGTAPSRDPLDKSKSSPCPVSPNCWI